MPRETERLGIGFPDLQEDPWGDLMHATIKNFDASIWAAVEDRNLALLGGGEFKLTTSSNVLEWTEDIILTTWATGLIWKIPGPDSILIADGQVMYTEVDRRKVSAALPVVRTVTGNVASRLVEAAPGARVQNLLAVAMRKGNNIIFGNGRILPPDLAMPILSIPADDALAFALSLRIAHYIAELSIHRHQTYEYAGVAAGLPTFTLPDAPRELAVYRNGLRQTSSVDYAWVPLTPLVVLSIPTVLGENFVFDATLAPTEP